jgi:hypothetical protein
MQKADITELNPAQLQICDAIERELPKMSRKQTARIVASLKEIMSRGSERFEISRALSRSLGPRYHVTGPSLRD